MKYRLASLCLCAAALPAQSVLFQHHGPAQSQLGSVVRPAGDVDGDGVLDFAATQPAENLSARVEVVSGRLGTMLWDVDRIDMPSRSSLLEAVGIGDADGDGHGEVVIATHAMVAVYSGATGQRLHGSVSSNGAYMGISEVGDVNADGAADLALAVYSNGYNEILLLDGRTGLRHGSIPNLRNNNAHATLRSLGDLTGDGRDELALGTSRDVYVVATSPPRVLRSLRTPLPGNFGEYMATADLDGDGRREILLARPGTPATTGENGRVEVYDPRTGNLRLAIERPTRAAGRIGVGIAGIGDLDADGIGDLVVELQVESPYGGVMACSGRTGAVLWTAVGEATFQRFGASLAALGDLDGDGYGDVAVGCPMPYPIAGGWKVLSGRILAAVTDVGGACGGGPFLPELGLTRPVLGRTATVVCRDGPTGAVGTLAFGPRPSWPTSFGASTCTAWFDLGSWVALHTTTQSQWALPLPIPDVPQLAGIELALQCYYLPTGGPLGFDLSNGLHARVGF